MLAANPRTDLVIVMLVTNDLLNGLSAKQVVERMEAFLKEIRPACKRLLVLSPPLLQRGDWAMEDTLLAEARALSQELSAAMSLVNADFIDTSSWQLPMAYDGIHLTQAGNRVLAERLWQHLR